MTDKSQREPANADPGDDLPEDRPTFLLIDGHALAYRAYHALPDDMTAADGEPTNASYGFVSMLLQVLSNHAPDHIAVAFDAGYSGRDEIYPEYKATRKEMDESLRVQMERIRELVDRFDIPVYRAEGWEADDVIATLADQAADAGFDTVVVTGDTDLFQIVDDHTSVVTSGRRFSDAVVYDTAAVEERYGVRADRLAEWKGLKGDTSDNIPGVPGIGKKSASRVIQDWGSVSEALSHLDDVEPTRARNALTEHRDVAELGVRLATIRRDAPVTFDAERALFAGFDRSRVMDLFRRLRFRSLVDRLPDLDADGTAMPDGGSAPDGDYDVVDTMEGLADLIERLGKAERIAFDTETTGTDPMQARLVGIALSDAPGRGWYVPVGHTTEGDPRESFTQGRLALDGDGEDDGGDAAAPSDPVASDDPSDGTGELGAGRNLQIEEVLAALRPILTGSQLKVAHHMKYDVIVLRRHGVSVAPPVFDTMVAAWLAEPGRRGFGLKALSWSVLGIEMVSIEELIGSGRDQITMAEVAIDRAAPYACADVDITLRLADEVAEQLEQREVRTLFDDVEMPVSWVLADMEQTGILVDPDVLADISADLERRMSELEARVFEEAGHPFNIGSPKQLGEVLFEEMGLPATRRTATGYSTAADALAPLLAEHEIARLVIDWRHVQKLKGTYVDALPELIHPVTGRIHTSWHQVTVVTGRISSSDPNLQNIPVRTGLGGQIRRAFVAPEDQSLLALDYSQMELRILASLSGDASLREVFAEGGDIHSATAGFLFDKPRDRVTSDERRVAKTVNFGTVYGISAYGLASRIGMSRTEAQEFIDRYYDTYPGVREYFDRILKGVAERGYVETVLGRRRYFPELRSDSPTRLDRNTRQRAEREAINAPLQGSAADITKVAMVGVHEALQDRGIDGRLLLQVHDELLLEVADDSLETVANLARELMTGAVELEGVSLTVDVASGPNWAELQPWTGG